MQQSTLKGKNRIKQGTLILRHPSKTLPVMNIFKAWFVEDKCGNHWLLLLQKGLSVVVKTQTRRFPKDLKRGAKLLSVHD